MTKKEIEKIEQLHQDVEIRDEFGNRRYTYDTDEVGRRLDQVIETVNILVSAINKINKK